MDTAQWPQGIGVVKPMEAVVAGSNNNNNNKGCMLERRTRPQKDQALNCPRCNSSNTKFCYYNNYSLSQPRYFCKTCRRYWTEGGSLRNVPVGGGSRKNKRSNHNPSTPTSSSLTKINKVVTNNIPDDFPPHQQNLKIHHGQDLNLAYPSSTTEDYNNKFMEIVPPNSSSAMELLKTTTTTTTSSSSRGLNLSGGGFMPTTVSLSDSSTMFSSGLNFSLEGFENGFVGGLQGIQDGNGARMLFPVEDLKHQQVPNSAEFVEQGGRSGTQGDSTGYWNGMLGGGSW